MPVVGIEFRCRSCRAYIRDKEVKGNHLREFPRHEVVEYKGGRAEWLIQCHQQCVSTSRT